MSVPVEERDNPDAAVFKDAEALSNAEVAFLLEDYLARKKQTSPTYQMPPIIKKTSDYVTRFRTLKSVDTARKVREFLANSGLQAYEVAALPNLWPETPEEAMTLIPSLQDKGEEVLNILTELDTYREFE